MYTVDVEYDGFYEGFDSKIELAAGRRKVSSGYAVWRVRDIQFQYDTESDAIAALGRITALAEFNIRARATDDSGSWRGWAPPHTQSLPQRRDAH